MKDLEQKLKNIEKFRCAMDIEAAIRSKISSIERIQKVMRAIKYLWLGIVVISISYFVLETYENLGSQFWTVFWINRTVFLSNFSDFSSMVISEMSVYGVTAIFVSFVVYIIVSSLSKLNLYSFKYE